MEGGEGEWVVPPVAKALVANTPCQQVIVYSAT